MRDILRALRIVIRRARAEFWCELHRQRARRKLAATPFD